MKQINYRVWHLDKEIFIEPYKLSLKPDGELYIWENQYDGDTLLEPNTYVIQLSSRLKDRNGVEIYDGDIILLGNNIFEVVWDGYYGALGFRLKFCKNSIENMSDTIPLMQYQVEKNAEIIAHAFQKNLREIMNNARINHENNY